MRTWKATGQFSGGSLVGIVVLEITVGGEDEGDARSNALEQFALVSSLAASFTVSIEEIVPA